MAKKILNDEMASVLISKLNYYERALELQEIGHVISLKDGVASIHGLDNVMMNELVYFHADVNSEVIGRGIVQNMTRSVVDIILLEGATKVTEGAVAKRTKKPVSVPVGFELLGRVVDALGEPMDGKGPINARETAPVERPAPAVIQRKSVSEPVNTGVKAIDCLVPIGRGQRELIIGDRKTGKTTIAIDTIINQKQRNSQASAKDKVYCVYVAIGQKQSSVAAIHRQLESKGAMDYTIIVMAGAAESASMSYIAPYSGCAMAEFFMYQGMHCIIVYDDLSKHAVAYRELSLLLRNPPGREAYPGDVFYLHSRLLERAAKLSDKNGGGSLTALPIVETQADDVSSYIPTNVISITDGQIFLGSALFNSGIFPAINIGLSVSRVGSSAQIKAVKKLAGSIKLELAQYREMEDFSRFGSELDDSTQKLLDRGRRLVEFFKQGHGCGLTFGEQAVLLFAYNERYLDNVPINKIIEFEKYLLSFIRVSHNELVEAIDESGSMSEHVSASLKQAITQCLDYFNKEKVSA